jgi:serine/threonine-protein kinase
VAEEFGAYIIHEKLGAGGMASVHIAESRTLRKRVALKRLHPHVAENPDLVKSFIHEARLARYLNHPNIARTFDFGQVGEIYYMAMELVPGPNLTQLSRQVKATVGTIPLPVSLHMITQVCDALDYAHNLKDEHGRPLNIIHRDISPPNIIVSNTGTVKLIDFGLAKAARSSVQTQVGTIKGKFSYIAPEYLGGQLDNRVDIWALGVIAWELLTMRRLFEADDDFEVLRQVKEMPIVPPSRHSRDIPGELDSIVLTALERDPGRRWQSAAAMRTAMQGMIRDLGVEITSRRVLQWVEWAFTQKPLEEKSGVSELIALLEKPSKVKTNPGAKQPKLPTPVKGAPTIKSRRRSRALLWVVLVLLVLAGGAAALWQWGIPGYVDPLRTQL